ncbi:hypothetical protein [Nostoc sp. CCY 9925]|uniref:hypothetical protein n=1 Tax=Nostoc sp. CCY 9925 TaxID=3103865 RepID=UPI0039C5F1EF
MTGDRRRYIKQIASAQLLVLTLEKFENEVQRLSTLTLHPQVYRGCPYRHHILGIRQMLVFRWL